MDDPEERWARDQRALARALGLSIEEWIVALDGAAARRTGLSAAVIGAAMAEGLGLGVLSQLDPPALVSRARALIDPRPPSVDNAILAEAIRRSTDDTAGPSRGAGSSRLRRKRAEPPSTPERRPEPLGDSSEESTPDAPGAGEPKGGGRSH